MLAFSFSESILIKLTFTVCSSRDAISATSFSVEKGSDDKEDLYNSVATKSVISFI